MTAREHRAETRLMLGRYCPPWLVYEYRAQRSIVPSYVHDPLADRAVLRAERPAVPALHPCGDLRAWRRLWAERDRRRCPARPEAERRAYVYRIEMAEREGARF